MVQKKSAVRDAAMKRTLKVMKHFIFVVVVEDAVVEEEEVSFMMLVSAT
jgi:hypothetical protein